MADLRWPLFGNHDLITKVLRRHHFAMQTSKEISLDLVPILQVSLSAIIFAKLWRGREGGGGGGVAQKTDKKGPVKLSKYADYSFVMKNGGHRVRFRVITT